MVVDDTLAYLPVVKANRPLRAVKYIIKACKKWAYIKDALQELLYAKHTISEYRNPVKHEKMTRPIFDSRSFLK